MSDEEFLSKFYNVAKLTLVLICMTCGRKSWSDNSNKNQFVAWKVLWIDFVRFPWFVIYAWLVVILFIRLDSL